MLTEAAVYGKPVCALRAWRDVFRRSLDEVSLHLGMSTTRLYALERHGLSYDAADIVAFETVLGTHPTQVLSLQISWLRDELLAIETHFERFLKGAPR